MNDGSKAVSGGTGKSWLEMEAAIEAAFRKLERVPNDDSGPGIPCETLIPGMGRQIAHMKPIDRTDPHQALSTPEEAARQLALVAKRARSLLASVEALNKPAIDALNYRQPWPGGFETYLRILSLKAETAEIPELPLGAGLGRPTKPQHLQIVKVVAEQYLALTGVKPTLSVSDSGPGGPFIQLLKDVFLALGLEPRVESLARRAIKAMDKRTTENTT